MDVFPIAYFGSIEYYRMLASAQNPIIETQEHFVKQTGRSRCEILGPNGKHTLSITTKKSKGSKTSIEQVEILDDDWRKNHWKSIETAYASSAYFDYYGVEIHELIFNNESVLIQYNQKIHQRICSWLDLPIDLKFSSSYVENDENINDYRNFDFSSALEVNQKKYTQVFAEKEHCNLNLSIIDLIFNQGPIARNWIISPN